MHKRRMSKARSVSAKARKKAKPNPVPRFRTLASNSINGRAQSIRTISIYSDYFTIDPPLASAAVHVLAANGLYDPNVTGVGHQANGFDQYMALYNRYTVVGSTIKIVARNTDASLPTCFGVFLEDFAGTSADWREYIESGNGNWTCIEGTGNAGAIRTLTHKADMSKFSTQDIYDDDTYSGLVGTNPSNTHYYHLVAWPHDGVSNVGGVQVQVEIRYDVIYREPSKSVLS